MILRLLDTIAGKWLEYRTGVMAKNDPHFEELELKDIDIRAGKIVMSHPAITYLADSAAAILDEANAENYVQFDMMPFAYRHKPFVRVTVQWANGMSPAIKAAKLQAKIDEVKLFHPRAWKLLEKKKDFLVVAIDEPYYLIVYNIIREHEKLIGRWNNEDEIIYQNALKNGEK